MERDVEKNVKYRSSWKYEEYDYLVECPNCKGFVYMRNYCSRCGQKLSIVGSVHNLPAKDIEE